MGHMHTGAHTLTHTHSFLLFWPQQYFQYITQYSHPSHEGLSFLNDLPKPLFEELTGREEVRSEGGWGHVCACVCVCS